MFFNKKTLNKLCLAVFYIYIFYDSTGVLISP